MIINSNFTDFYDRTARLGIDRTVIYNRKETTVPMVPFWHSYDLDDVVLIVDNKRFSTGIPLRLPKASSSGYHKFEFSPFILGFCGELRFGAYVQLPDQVGKFIYDVDTLNTIVKDRMEIIRQKNKKDFSVTDYISKVDSAPIFVALKAPLFLYTTNTYHTSPLVSLRVGNHEFIKNPCLKTIEFHKIMNPHETFSRIQSYISGVLTSPEKPISDIPDKYKIGQKGFDDKWSFRKKVR